VFWRAAKDKRPGPSRKAKGAFGAQSARIGTWRVEPAGPCEKGGPGPPFFQARRRPGVAQA